MTSGADAAELRARLTDPRHVCEALGLLEGYKPDRQAGGGLIIRCPSHGERNPSCSVRRGRDGTIQVRCFACSFAGDVLTLIAAARGLEQQRDFAAVLAEGARLAGYAVGSAPRREELRAPPPAPPAPTYPPSTEVHALWEACVPVTDDEQARTYLAGRAIDPERVARLDLARVLPAITQLPSWARSRGKPWGTSGHRLIVPMFNHRGELCSLRAGVVWPVEGDSPKRVAPAGFSTVGLVMACLAGRSLLASGQAPAGVDVVISEGEPDFLTIASLPTAGERVVLGVVASAWAEAFAERIPDGARVIIRTHRDPAGDRYAAAIQSSLAWRTERVSTLDFPRPSDPTMKLPDDNDSAQRGELQDHLAGVVSTASATVRPASTWRPLVSLVGKLREAPAKLRTGIPNLDDGWRGGIPTGFLWVVGGAPGAGKTTWITNLGHEWARHGVPVAFIAGDESREGVMIRLGQQAGIDRRDLEEGRDEALDRLETHFGELPLLLVDPDDDDDVDVSTVAAELRQRWPSDGPAVLIVDSLQAMARRIPDSTADTPRSKVEAFLKSCKAMAKRHQLVIILLSELARGAYRGGNEQTSDLAAAKESGAIEYEAGALCVLRAIEGDPGLVSVSWAKSRLGRVDPFSLRIDHKTATVSAEAPASRDKAGEQGAEARHLELMRLVADLVKRSPGLAGARAAAARLERRRSDVIAAIDELLQSGVIENRGSAKRPQLYLAPGGPGNDEGEDNGSHGSQWFPDGSGTIPQKAEANGSQIPQHPFRGEGVGNHSLPAPVEPLEAPAKPGTIPLPPASPLEGPPSTRHALPPSKPTPAPGVEGETPAPTTVRNATAEPFPGQEQAPADPPSAPPAPEPESPPPAPPQPPAKLTPMEAWAQLSPEDRQARLAERRQRQAAQSASPTPPPASVQRATPANDPAPVPPADLAAGDEGESEGYL